MMAVSVASRRRLADERLRLDAQDLAVIEYPRVLTILQIQSLVSHGIHGEFMKMNPLAGEATHFYLNRTLLGTTFVFDDPSADAFVRHAAGCGEYRALLAIQDRDFESAAFHVDETLRLAPSSAAASRRLSAAFAAQQRPDLGRDVQQQIAANIQRQFAEFPDSAALREAQSQLVQPCSPLRTPGWLCRMITRKTSTLNNFTHIVTKYFVEPAPAGEGFLSMPSIQEAVVLT